MAYRSGLSIRFTLLARRLNPLSTYLSHENDRSKHEKLHPSKSTIKTYLEQRRSFGSIANPNLGQFSGAFHRTGSMLVGSELCLNRYMSASIGKENKTNYAADVITAAPMEVVSEVAIAAADSAFPVAAFQYLIDGVHSYTGLEWWACIALTTLIIRGATVPILISLLKANSKLKIVIKFVYAFFIWGCTVA